MTLALTEELLAKVHRVEVDAGPTPGARYLSDDDFAAIRDSLLAAHATGNGVWIFAYGSLLWNPCFEAVEARQATLHGWHRRFSLWLTRWRGTHDFPGLMLALDRGGSCRGMLYRLPEEGLAAAIDTLLQREMSSMPPTNVPRWVAARSGGETVRAIAFVADRAGPAYAAGVGEERTVEILALAAGHIGSCADYLRRTVVQLERLNIRDSGLWRLQSKVAAHIASLPSPRPSPVSTMELPHACEG